MENFFAGEILTELLKLLGKSARGVYFCRQTAQEVRHNVEQLMPIFRDIQYSEVELPQHLQSQLGVLGTILNEGYDVARKAATSNRWNVYQSHRLSRRLVKFNDKLEKWLRTFPGLINIHLQLQTITQMDQVRRTTESMVVGVGTPWQPPANMVGTLVAGMGALDLRKDVNHVMDVAAVRVGKDKVKAMLLEENEAGNVVAICGIGGSGKTTLAMELCRDPVVRDHFKERIFFETVSQSPDMGRLKQKLWEKLHNKLPPWPPRIEADSGMPEPMLVVLDDVWSEENLEELLQLVTPGCKTLVISRFKFRQTHSNTYELELLGEEEALRLFCQCAFGQQSVPLTAERELVMQVVAECRGLPLALKVIGASLKGQPHKIWTNAKDKLSLGQAISEAHEAKLLKSMAVSIDRLSRKERECFLDLGCFPEDMKIPMDALINMWMEVYDLTEEDAYETLVKLADKCLLDLVKDVRSRTGDEYSSYIDFSASQHDVLRDVAIYMSNCVSSINQRDRLIMAKKEKNGGLPKEWERGTDLPFDARIVSVHTGEMKEFDWYEMHFPKAEALILNFSGATYCLPPFIRNMPKLKVLILVNNGCSSTVLPNSSIFSSLHNLRSLWFEKIAVPPLPQMTSPLLKLRKLSLTLCEFDENLQGFIADLPRTFPRLSDLTIDHCPDLMKLPHSVCEISTLQSLTISNCHELCELPPELANLPSLRILRVCACPSLEELPESIGQLTMLEYLDISQCIGLQCLPDGLGLLRRLKKVDMRECVAARVPSSVAFLASLRRVVCSEDAALMWRDSMGDVQELDIQVVEEFYSMDWFE